MTGILIAIGIGVLATLAIIFFCIAGVLFGAFTGWLLMQVGLAGWVYAGLAQLGFHVTNLWQLGGALGFVGGFFKGSSWYKSKKD